MNETIKKLRKLRLLEAKGKCRSKEMKQYDKQIKQLEEQEENIEE